MLMKLIIKHLHWMLLIVWVGIWASINTGPHNVIFYDQTLTGTLNGCTTISLVTVNVGGVGINNYKLDNAISIIPNPNEGQFELFISIPEIQDVEISLYNSIGQMIKTDLFKEVMESIISYDLSDQPGGIYYLNVKSNNGNTTKRLLILD